MSHRHTNITHHGGVGEIPLQAGDRELMCQMLQVGHRDTEIALSILKVNGIDLVRHGRGAHLTLLNLLLEVLHRDIHPYVPTEVYEDRRDPLEAIQERRKVIIIRDLGRILLQPHTEVVGKVIGEVAPVDLRESDMMSIHIARSATKLYRLRDEVK